MKKTIQSKVAALANHLYYSTSLSQSEAWAKAWKVCKLKEAMKEGQAQFTFLKTDGKTERKAVGTLKPYSLPKSKGTGKQKPLHQITYFDVDVKGFRSFRAQNIISISE